MTIPGREPRRIMDMRSGLRRPLANPVFSGTAYVAGTKTTGLNNDDSKPWVKCVLSTGVASEQVGPPSDPFPEDEEWFEKANTYGDIHVVRA